MRSSEGAARRFKDEAEAQERCVYWQAALRLEDWDVDVRIVNGNDMDQCWGQITAYRRFGSAVLKLSTIHTDQDGDEIDQEQSLVHELLHLRFDAIEDCIDRDSYQYTLYERAIDQLAWSLVKMDRAKAQDIPLPSL